MIDGRKVGMGTPGPVTAAISKLYQSYVGD
jgi:hypothetical protein